MLESFSTPEFCSLWLFICILVGNLIINIFVKGFPNNLTPMLNLVVGITLSLVWSPLDSYSLYTKLTMGISSGMLPVAIYYIGHNVRDYFELKRYIVAKDLEKKKALARKVNK